MAVKKKVVEIDTQQAETSVKGLRLELKALKDTLLSAEEGTKEYSDAMQRAADIQHTLKEQMEEVNANAMDFGQIAGNVVKATGGIVGGFQAAQAAMNLFGVENENVLKAMQKMQNLMAITLAIPAIDEGIKAYGRLNDKILGFIDTLLLKSSAEKADTTATAAATVAQNANTVATKSATVATNSFKKALISTGIGAIVVAIGALIANWDKLTAAINKSEIAAAEAAQAIVDNIKQASDALKGMLSDVNKMSDETLANLKELAWQDLVAATKADEMGVNATDLVNTYNRYLNALRNGQVELARDSKLTLDNLLKDNEVTRNAFDNFIKTAEALHNREVDNNKKDEKATKSNNSTKKELKKSLEELNEEMTIWLQNNITEATTHDAVAKAILERNKQLHNLRETEAEEEDTSVEDNYKGFVENTINRAEALLIAEQDQYDAEQRALEAALNTKLISQQQYNQMSEALAKEHSDAQKTLAVQEAQVWMSALGNLGSIFSSIADTIDLGTEEGKEKYKALMYTSTIVSMLAGVGGAIASAFMPVNAGMTIFGQIAMAATTSASVIASGIAQLLQIKNANENSTLSASASPNASAITAINAPVQYTQDVQGANIEGSIKDSKVYVTETDITNTQNKVNVAESEARF